VAASENNNTAKVMYEARRQARGPEHAARGRSTRRRLVFWTILVLCAAGALTAYFIVWSLRHVTTVRATVRAIVVTVSPVADGRVQEVTVSTGQTVAQGDLLGRLQDLGVRPALARAAVEEARARVQIAEAGVAAAEAALALRKSTLELEIRRAQAQVDESQARFQRTRVGPQTEKIEAAKARLATANALVALAALELEQTTLLVAEGIESKLTLEAKKTELTVQESRKQEARFALAELEGMPVAEELEISKRALAASQADLALARAGDKEVQSLVPELAARKAQLREAKAALVSSLATLEEMSLTSPVSGTVVRTFVSPGEVCRKGAPFASVTDDAAGRWIEAFIHEKHARRVKTGQHATVEIVTGSRRYIDAVVDSVAAVTSSVYQGDLIPTDNPNPAATGRPELVCVKLKPLEDINAPLPGMSARAVIDVY